MNIAVMGISVPTNIAGFGTTNALTWGMTVPRNKKKKISGVSRDVRAVSY
jgi:hypothetical protein